jgi:CO/xanthine dehydrogenase Mo-binding subunit
MIQTLERPLDIVGQRVTRLDGADKVTGRAQYIADILLPAARCRTPASSASTPAAPSGCRASAR